MPDKKDENKKDEKISQEEIDKITEELINGTVSDEKLKEFEKKLMGKKKRSKGLFVLKSILIYLAFALVLYAVNIAAFGFLSSHTVFASWQKALIYLLCITISMLFVTLISKIMMLFIPGMSLGLRPIFFMVGRLIVILVLMIICNYNCDYLVFDSTVDIIVFLIISYIFQFAVAYYRLKFRFRKLF